MTGEQTRLVDELRDQAAAIEELRDQVTYLTAAVDQIETAAGDIQALLGGGPDGQDPAASAGVDLAELAEWVHGTLAEIYTRPVGALRWCSRWWEHPEAIVRLEACRRAWTDLGGAGGTGLSVWHRDHLDPMLAVLLSPTGPFRACEAQPGHHTDNTKHRVPSPLPVMALPPLPTTTPPPGR